VDAYSRTQISDVNDIGALAPPRIPGDALMIATGLSVNGLSPYGLDAKSIHIL
jgi:hypothetical protein